MKNIYAMDYTLINKYLSGIATEKEVGEIFMWIKSSPSNKLEFIKYKQAWALSAKSNKNSDIAWTNVQRQTTAKDNTRFLLQNMMKYAAILIVILGIGIAFRHILTEKRSYENSACLERVKIDAPFGQITNINLPDGTTVVLNSGSTLSYHIPFIDSVRNVKLQGEAYFAVANDSEHLFIVETQSVDLKVYGTSFNVEAYPEDKHVNTTLVEGSLAVVSKKGEEMVRLVPGENATYEKMLAKLTVSEVDMALYMSWKEGIVSFRNERLENIATKIERMYDVEIRIRNKNLRDGLYSGTILRNKPPEQILEVLKLTASIEYEIVTRADQPSLIYWD